MSDKPFLIQRTAAGRLPSGESCAEFKLSELAVNFILDALCEFQSIMPTEDPLRPDLDALVNELGDAINEFPVIDEGGQ